MASVVMENARTYRSVYFRIQLNQFLLFMQSILLSLLAFPLFVVVFFRSLYFSLCVIFPLPFPFHLLFCRLFILSSLLLPSSISRILHPSTPPLYPRLSSSVLPPSSSYTSGSPSPLSPLIYLLTRLISLSPSIFFFAPISILESTT